MRRLQLSGERGEMSLTEILVALSIFAGVLGATLTTFMNFDTLSRRNVDRTASQDSARTSVDRLVRDLRNLASPTIAQPQAVDRADDYDLIFQTVDSNGPNAGANAANIKRVRWCLDQTTPSNEKLVVQEQTWTTQTAEAPTATNCPGAGWAKTSVMASNLTNTYNGNARPLFTYNSATFTAISEIHVDLYSDIDPTRTPSETHLTSGVFLRNQNQMPVASFSKALSGTKAIVLNGSASYDPEGQGLKYFWWDNGTRIKDANNKVVEGITYTYPVTSGSTHALQLKVYDPAGLEGVSPIQTVNVP